MALTLPKPDLPVFNGNPIEYCDFVREFDCLIEAKTDSSSSLLYYLIQYTRGEVQELMRSCLSMNPDEGYAEARRLLKSKYGQNYKIATEFVDKVTKGPRVKAEDPKALQNLSVLLISCKNTLNEIGHRNKIENPDSLKAVVERLPYDLRRNGVPWLIIFQRFKIEGSSSIMLSISLRKRPELLHTHCLEALPPSQQRKTTRRSVRINLLVPTDRILQ